MNVSLPLLYLNKTCQNTFVADPLHTYRYDSPENYEGLLTEMRCQVLNIRIEITTNVSVQLL